MKKNLLAIAIAIIAATSVQADQAIYKTKGTVTIIGRGTEQKMKPDFGYWVYDPEKKQLTTIAALSMHGKKVIQIVEADNLNIISVRGLDGKRYTSIAKAESPSKQMPVAVAEGIYAIGQDFAVALDGIKTTFVPKNFRSIGFNHLSFGAGHFMSTQSQGAASLDLKASQDSNRRKEGHDEAVNRISAGLKAKGYVENPRLLKSK
jgi:hypothetical protein